MREGRLHDAADPMNDPADGASAREAATRAILDLISRSRDDERPVFDAILQRAADLCGASSAGLIMARAGDSHQRLVAHVGAYPAPVEIFDRGEVPMDPDVSSSA
jgi:hypothetical protein